MSLPEPDLQRDLDDALIERARLLVRGRGDDEATRAVTSRIVELAETLGLSSEEAADLIARSGLADQEHALVGEFRVLRRPAAVLAVFWGLALAAIIMGLEQPVAAAGLAVMVIAVAITFDRRRVARLRIGHDGALSLPGALDHVDFATLAVLDFAYRYPRGVPEFRKASYETVALRFQTADGRVVTLARGSLWRVKPDRAPIAYARLERLLRDQARKAGMTILARTDGWTARR